MSFTQKLSQRIRQFTETLSNNNELRKLRAESNGIIVMPKGLVRRQFVRLFDSRWFQPSVWTQRSDRRFSWNLNRIVAGGFRRDGNRWVWEWDGFSIELPNTGYDPRAVIVNDLREIFFEGSYSRHLPFGCVVRDGDVVIDAGSNIGAFAIWAARVGPAVRVFAFEPDPSNFETLVRNVEANGMEGRIMCYRLGLWSTQRRLRLESHPTAFTMHRVVESGTCTNGVECVDLDGFLQRRGVGTCAVIKMDIEGAELEAVIGARATIERDGPRLSIGGYHQPGDCLAVAAQVIRTRADYNVVVVPDGHLFAFVK